MLTYVATLCYNDIFFALLNFSIFFLLMRRSLQVGIIELAWHCTCSRQGSGVQVRNDGVHAQPQSDDFDGARDV